LKTLIVDGATGIREVVSLALGLLWDDANILVGEIDEGSFNILEDEHRQLMMLDLGRDGIDGYDVLSVTRSVSDLPVIMLTSIEEEPNITKILDRGADNYMAKPFNHLILLEREHMQSYTEASTG
jgi:DNA-binding response OmpR family regulator